MKVLVATSRTQGQRDNDYHWCVDGELVQALPACASDKDDPEGGCGCGRGFAGLNSHKATTTAAVAEVPLAFDDYVEAIRSSMEDGGWPTHNAPVLAASLVTAISDLPIGTVIERRLDWIRARPSAL
ncbi:hypothetical protein EV193_104295 [Herbihabitans rhizosphaerae]|uniref:DUF7715 domain-containing protein n=1 Tax=Herbihabitans rhizosphaerae TaxID=1872711 RepID=A0A4Q7KRF4_9PSEU|nr:hypothetical protein [Herbihabitans rhizosphaerae]RZS39084.1 hypothetical protein EV193_104295 [Herbihabitans rhizosphaerae]